MPDVWCLYLGSRLASLICLWGQPHRIRPVLNSEAQNAFSYCNNNYKITTNIKISNATEIVHLTIYLHRAPSLQLWGRTSGTWKAQNIKQIACLSVMTDGHSSKKLWSKHLVTASAPTARDVTRDLVAQQLCAHEYMDSCTNCKHTTLCASSTEINSVTMFWISFRHTVPVYSRLVTHRTCKMTHRAVNTLNGRGVNWCHFAIQV